MYCSACASPVTAGLKFCNRCGANLNKDQEESGGGLAGGLITAVVMVALFGLGIMFAGAIAFKKGGDMPIDIVGLFMLFSAVIIGITEVFLLRQLSRALGAGNQSKRVEHPAPPPLFQPAQSAPARELHAMREMPEPSASVTENTTRTLVHSIRDTSPK
jgi:hypothetical protein